MRSLVVGLVLAVVPPAPATIDDYLASALDSTGLPGVSVVITHGDRIVHATGAGHDSTGRPVTADTPMRVASVSKSFTAAAVLTLGLELDEPVGLPSIPREVTVRQLLNQTSGITDNSVDIGRLESARTLAEYESLLAPVTLTSEPGTKWAYSNVNYDVAARLVEVASGQPFDEYVRSQVFEPLGMRDSSVGGWAADGYNSLFGLWFSRPELAGGPSVNGAGGVVTTARDMGRWLMAQNGHGPLPDSMLRAMHQPSTVDEYGMGWSPDENGLLVHSGNLWTYNAIQAIDPRTGYGYAVMTNGATLADDTSTILAGLVALTRGESPEPPGNSMIEWVLAAVILLSLTLSTLGIRNARRWAIRRLRSRESRSRWGSRWLAMSLRSGHEHRRERTVHDTQRPQRPVQDISHVPNGPSPQNHNNDFAEIPAQNRTPTLSRGRPALPVYRQGVTEGGKSILPVDKSVGCGQLRIWLRLVPLLVPALLFVGYPELVSFISAGRTVLWAQLFYFALPLTVTLAVTAVGGLAVFVARVVRLRSVR